MIDTLQRMNHHIWTIFGNSKVFANRTSWKKPIVGISQGNDGASPQIWAAVSLPLFTIMQSDRFFAQVLCTILGYKCNIIRFAFVDDTDLCVSQSDLVDQMIASHLQAAVTNWEGLLKVTGGALVPDKCFWYTNNQMWMNDYGCINKSASTGRPGGCR